MSDVLIEQDTMEDIGNAIREKLGVSDTYLPASMPAAIRSISGGGGGGSAKYSETVLWEGNARPNASTSYTLSDSIENYDALILIGVGYTNGTSATMHTPLFVPVSEITYGTDPTVGYTINASVTNLVRRPTFCFTDSTHFKVIYVDSSENTNTGYIKVIGIRWETMQTALVYSEEEREVGVWTDGKPLYQKTIPVTASTSTNYVDIQHGISNIDRVIKSEGYIYYTGSQSGIERRFMPQLYYTAMGDMAVSVYMVSDTALRVIYGSWLKGLNQSTVEINITIYYTKTTDTPGSGIWTTTGEYAHHYSTTEHIIGTWIDGKTLYEKTMIVNNPSINTWVEYDIGVPDLDRVIKQEGTFDRVIGSGGVWTYDLNAVNESSWNNSYVVVARIRNATKKLAVYVGGTYPNSVIRFTFCYTKTT